MTEEVWLECEDPDYLLPFFTDNAQVADRKLRLFACACCERISRHVDPDLIALLRLAGQYADGVVTSTELGNAHDAARERFGTLPGGDDPHRSATEIANEAFILTAEIKPDPSNRDRNTLVPYAQEASALAAITLEMWPGNRRAMLDESAFQCGLLRELFGNPFRPVSFTPEWRTDTALTLARQMYDSREFGAMPILADAIQDAGCDSEDLLHHLRDANATHVRGCWALDLVLGKE